MSNDGFSIGIFWAKQIRKYGFHCIVLGNYHQDWGPLLNTEAIWNPTFSPYLCPRLIRRHPLLPLRYLSCISIRWLFSIAAVLVEKQPTRLWVASRFGAATFSDLTGSLEAPKRIKQVTPQNWKQSKTNEMMVRVRQLLMVHSDWYIHSIMNHEANMRHFFCLRWSSSLPWNRGPWGFQHVPTLLPPVKPCWWLIRSLEILTAGTWWLFGRWEPRQWQQWGWSWLIYIHTELLMFHLKHLILLAGLEGLSGLSRHENSSHVPLCRCASFLATWRVN